MTLSSHTAAVLLALFSIAHLAVAEYNPNEHFVAMDCGIGSDPAHPEWATSFFVEYFPGEVWEDAEETKMVPTSGNGARISWDGSYPWRESGITFTMGNEDQVQLTVRNAPNSAQCVLSEAALLYSRCLRY